MIARRAVWNDERVRAALARFVPAADEVGRLQRVDDPEGVLFRTIAEQGHYAGRTRPTNTRQGLYAATAGGRLLASINHNDPGRVARMLEEAWAAWEALPPAERGAGDWDGATGRRRIEDRYPAGGLALRVVSRDLPRDTAPHLTRDWRVGAWNLDFAWFRAEEAASTVPERLEVGATRSWPASLADRIVRLHLVDNVRGQTWPVEPKHLEEAVLGTTVTAIDGPLARLRIAGRGRWEASGRWTIGGMTAEPTDQRRGYRGTLLGTATWNAKTSRYEAFEIVATGIRWGATQYNGRHDDLDPAPIGHLFTLAGDTPAERVAPASYWSYGWR